MRYFLLMSSILLWSFSSDAEFVRKEKRPDFFVPEAAFTKQEKLPPISAQPAKTNEMQTSNRVTRQPEKRFSYSNKTKNTKTNKTDEDIAQKNFQEMQKTPEYQKKYDEYFQDINKLKRSGRLPENSGINRDLQKMNGKEFPVQ